MIKYLVVDVDGTLTDGTVYIGNNGELCKGFYVRDGLGLQRIIKKGITPIILTSRQSDIVINRCRELGINEIHQGVAEKKYYLECLMKERNIAGKELAYIADDINDLDAIQLAQIRACPRNAVEEIKCKCNFISKYNGGQGAVREFCDYLLKL